MSFPAPSIQDKTVEINLVGPVADLCLEVTVVEVEYDEVVLGDDVLEDET